MEVPLPLAYDDTGNVEVIPTPGAATSIALP